MRHASDIILILDESGRILEANERALSAYGYTLAELRALPPAGLRLVGDAQDFRTQFAHSAANQGAAFETAHRRKDGSTFPVEVTATFFTHHGRRYTLGIYRDITQRKEQEARIARLGQLYTALSRINRAIVESSSSQQLLQRICHTLVDDGGFTMAWIGACDAATGDIKPVVSAGDRTGYLQSIRISIRNEPLGEGPTGTAVRERRTYVCNDFLADPHTLPWREAASAAGFRASISMPVTRGQEVAHSLTVYAGIPGFFGEREINLLEEAARDISFGLEHLERIHSLHETQARLSTLVDSSPLAIIALDNEGKVRLWNPAAERLFGWSQAELLGQPNPCVPPDLKAATEDMRLQLLAGGSGSSIETRRQRKDGRQVDVALSLATLRDPQGRVTGTLGLLQDISEQKRAFIELRASEQRYRTLFENSMDGLFLTAPDGKILSANPAACRMVGYTEEEIIHGGRELLVDWTDPRLKPLLGERARVGRATGELRFRRADGTTFEAEVSSAVFQSDEGPRASVIIRDITERKVAAQRLLEREQDLREAQRIARLGSWRLNSDTNEVVWTEELYRMFGLDPAESPPPYDQHQHLFTAESWQRLNSTLTHALQSGGGYELELEIVRTDGSHGWMLARGETVRDADGRRTGMRGVALDITARREAERRIREQAELLNQTSEAIIVVGADHRINFWNRGAERMFGWSALEMTGKRIGDLFTLGILGFGSGAGGDPQALEFRGEIHGQNRAGKPLVIERSVTALRDESGGVIGQLNICADITERKSLEERFLRAQRLESIGMLAAGIAHDLNNVLTPFTMAVPLLRQRTSVPGDLKLLDTLEKCTERGAGLVRQILGFAHGISGEPRTVQVKHLLRDVHQVMTETFPKSIVLEEEIPKDLWPVLANPTQLHQVLLNLCVNARDAMPNGGTLRIAGENVTLDAAAAAVIEGARPGDWLRLEVRDSGTGIPPEVLPHIWEPFFTTKSAGKGTGLGLPTVRGIVEAHKGFITLDSVPNRGTTFHIYLPAMDRTAPPARAAETGQGADLPKGRGELILLVDDEAMIRETAKTILTQGGYRVIVAADGREGAAIFESHPERFALVIADRAMPVLDGPGFARLIRAGDPKIKILEITGMERTKDALDEPFADALVHKPFTVEELLQAVRDLLRAGVPAGRA